MIRILAFILGLVALAPASLAKPSVTAARIGQHPGMTRFVLELSEAPAYRIFTLPDPFRVVIDLPELDWRLPADQVPHGAGGIDDLRFGLFAPGTSRVVLDLSSPIEFKKPDSVSAIRGMGFPPRGSSVTVLLTSPPSSSGGVKWHISSPWPYVPEAERTGLRSSREPTFTVRFGMVPRLSRSFGHRRA